MQIIIDGSPVVLKQGTSIEYISENRLFTDADAYTLSITLPLAGCAENLAVFGHINRADVEAEKILLDCEIRDGAFVKSGSVAVTEINDTEVKVQFLEGRSAQNYSDDFSSIYINELELGLEAMGEVADLTPEQAWHNGRALESVALPWVNTGTVNKDNLVIQNGAEWDEGSKSWRWSGTTKGLSLFHYLIRLVQGVADAVGYEIDLSEWEAREELRYLLVCNTLPWAWGVNEWARALPRWSVEEFFQKLELFLGAQIDVDHRLKSISLSFLKSEQRGVVELREVVDEFTRTVTLPEDTDETYLGARNIRYKECEHEMWKFYSCDWFIDQYPQIKRYATMEQLLEDTKQFRTWRGMTTRNDKIHSIFYAEDVDTHFLILPVSRRYVMTGTRLPGWQYTCVLRPVNIFGGAHRGSGGGCRYG